MYKNGGEINFRPDYVHFADYQSGANYISGQEKPIMIYHDGRWFTWLDNIKNTVFGGLPNVTHFFLNREMPEIYIQDCRSLRDHYVSKNGLPHPGTIIERQLHDRKVLGTYKIKKETQTCINDKNCLAVKQLWKMGRADIITNWLQICNEHRDTHQYQIQWTNNFSYNPMLCWLIDIDSLESVNTSEFHFMLHQENN